MAELWLDAEDETSTSSINEIDKILPTILREVKAHRQESASRFDSVDSANEEIIKLQRELMEKTNKIEELSEDLRKLLNTLEDDVSTPKRIDSIYNLEMLLGGTILGSVIIFYKALGLIAFPIIVLGLGIFFTSFMSKRRINKVRSEYGI